VPEPLPYALPAERYDVPRGSRPALVAFGLAVLQVILYFAVYRWVQNQTPEFAFYALLAALIVPAGVTSFVAVIAMTRIANSGRRLRGMWIAVLAGLLAAGLPIGVVLHTLWRIFYDGYS
jgi:hypothetical protein